MTGSIRLPETRAVDGEMVLWAGGSQRLSQVLTKRGITTRSQVRQIIDPLSEPEPDLSQYPPLVQALERINSALAQHERIAIYGDYDVDGITATTVLVQALERLGGDVIWHIPNRFSEGYGMNSERVAALAQAGAQLLITCDCGISNHDEVVEANRLGMDVIITDHHTPPESLPPAHSIVNFKLLPAQHPSRDLPGVGTAFVLCRQLLQQHGQEADDLLDMVALGVIADVVPLWGHNRQLYAKGLPLLNEPLRPGLAALLAVANIQPGLVDEEKLGFQIGPRINAAGRLEDGSVAVRLFLTRSQDEAVALARELDQLNSLRKELGRTIVESISPTPGQALVAYQPDWHQGIIGIAAGQYASSNQVPVLLMTDSSQGEGIVGSARSVEGIDIYQVLRQCSQHLDRFGGHPAAAGFSLARDNLAAFKKQVSEVLAQQLVDWTPPPLEVDLVVAPKEVNLDLVEELDRLSPCGEGNPRPLLYCENMQVKSVRGVSNGHIIILGTRWHSFTAGVWGRPAPDAGSAIGAVFTVSMDVYRGERGVWATLEGWWPSSQRPESIREQYIFQDLRGGSWRQVLKKFPGASVYREGVRWQDFPGGTRNNVEIGSPLLLLTAPPSAAVLRQVLAMAEPSAVVLAYSRSEDNFMLDFLGAIKYVLRQGGIISLTQLAAALGTTEQTILAALKLLSVSGILSYQVEQGKLILQKLPGGNIKPGEQREQLLLHVEEVNAFRHWLQKATVEEINRISR